MRFLEWADSRTRRLSVVDVALVKWSCIAGGVLLAQLMPSVRRLDPRLVAAVTVGLAIKPAVTALRTKPSGE